MHDQKPNGELKQFSQETSGRASIIHGSKQCRGVILVPEQILLLLHDTQPGWPIPDDAEYRGIDMRSNGQDSYIKFMFVSREEPALHCFELTPEFFFKTLKDLADGLIPSDSELDGIEMSKRWTYMQLRVKSAHWPEAAADNLLPLYHLRYLGGYLELLPPQQALKRKIFIQ